MRTGAQKCKHDRKGRKLNKLQRRQGDVRTHALQIAAEAKHNADLIVRQARDVVAEMEQAMSQLRAAVPAAEKLAEVRTFGFWKRLGWAWRWAKRGTV